jgi:hypothetical protein
VTRIRFPLAVAALLLLLPSAVVDAEDRVILTNGKVLRGTVVEESESGILFEPAIGGEMEIPRSRIKEIIRGDDGPVEPAAGRVEAEAWFLVYGPGPKLMGWRMTRVTKSGDDRLYETTTSFLGEEAATTIRVVERVGPDGAPRAFTHRELTEGKKETLRRGEIRGETLHLTESDGRETTRRTIPWPKGTWLFEAARAHVLSRRGELEGGLETSIFDPLTVTFGTVRWSIGDKETVERDDGRVVEVVVLRAARGGVVSEERVDAEGRTVSAELNGPSITAVAVEKDRVDRLREGGAAEGPDGDAERLQNTHVDLEAGFSIRKPGAGWTFEKGTRNRKVTLKNLESFSYVDVVRDTFFPKGTSLETYALNLQRRLDADSDEFEKIGDGYTTLGGQRAYWIEARCVLRKDEKIRSLAVATIHEDVAWVVIAACPRDYFEAAKPAFDRILKSFELLE